MRNNWAALSETNGHLTKHRSNARFYSNSGYEVFRFLTFFNITLVELTGNIE